MMLNKQAILLILVVQALNCFGQYDSFHGPEPEPNSDFNTTLAQSVDAEWLKTHLEDPEIVILDCHYDRDNTSDEIPAFEREHLPHAVHLEIEKIGKNTTEVRRAFLSNEVFQAYVRSLGVNATSHVIVYDHAAKVLSSAPRAWFVFKSYGHDRISILNGGLNNWKRLGYDVESGKATRPKEGNFVAKFDDKLVASYEDVIKRIDDPTQQLLDARSPKTYEEAHIKSAISVPSESFFNEKGLLYSKDQMRDELKKRGVDLEGTPIAYCSSAMGSSVLTFLLRRADVDVTNFNGAIHQVKEKNPELIVHGTNGAGGSSASITSAAIMITVLLTVAF